MKRWMALLLTLLLVLSGCAWTPAPKETEPTSPATLPTEASQPPSTQPSQQTEPPLSGEADAYLQAIRALEQAQRLELEISLSQQWTFGSQSFSRQQQEKVVLENDTQRACRRLRYDQSDTQREYTQLFADGKLYLLEDGFFQEMTWQELLGQLPPLQLLQPDNYESISQSSDTLVFAGALAGESWLLPPQAEFVSALGSARMENGQLLSTGYSLSYRLAGTLWQTQVQVRVVGTGDKASSITAGVPTGSKQVSSVAAIPMLDMALAALHQSNCFTVDAEQMVQIQAGALARFDSSVYSVVGENSGMTSRIEMVQNGEETRTTYREKLVDGQLSYGFDDDTEDTAPANPQQILGIYYDFWSQSLPTSGDIEDISLTDLGEFWEIRYELINRWGKDYQALTCETLYNDAAILDNLASSYKTNQAEGTLYIDKFSMLPSTYTTTYLGTHTIQSMGYRIYRQYSAAFDFDSSDAYENIFDRPPVIAEPSQKATPLFYRVTTPQGGQLYLLGTIHVGDARTAWLPQELLDALKEADALALEVDLDETEKLLDTDEDFAQALSKSYYYTNDTYESHLEKELYEKVKLALAATGASPTYSPMMRPMILEQLLAEQYVALDGRLDYAMGVDNQLLDMAQAQGKKVYSIEDIREHTLLSGSFREEIQVMSLEGTMEYSRLEFMEELMQMYEMWCRGDKDELLPYLEQEDLSDLTAQELELYQEYNRKMMLERNDIMVKRALEYLNSGETVFFAVGCAHLVGETGLLNGLAQAGCTITQIHYGV